jgi:class 3 adenylate cyclase
VTTLPETKYARSGDLSIAYQVLGDGPIDLVIVPGFVSHVEFFHEIPGYTHWLRGFSSFARVIRFDKRGGGLSDRVTGVPSLEERMDDVRAVMDAVGSERAALFGWSEGGPMSLLFAATYPERTTALIVFGSFSRILRAADYPIGTPALTYADFTRRLAESWGTGRSLDLLGPSMGDNAELRTLWAKFERLSASPGAVRAIYEMNGRIDIRSILPMIQTPTLVLHRKEDSLAPFKWGQYIADHVPGARMVALEGRDHMAFWGDADTIVAEVKEFLTGTRHDHVETERILATVLFTDIVGSTARAAELGDSRWRGLLDAHDELVARQLERFRGRLVKSTGDGILATFDGPARAINCARAIRDGVRALGLEITAGLHTGEVEVRGHDIGGIAVHIASRVREHAEPGEVMVSRTMTDLVAGSGLVLESRGEHELQGIGEHWELFALAE